jgi:hypothetical protein
MLAIEDTLQHEGKRHFAVASNLLFLEAWYYSKHAEEYEYIPSEPVGSITKYAALNFVSVEDIVSNARLTAVIDPGPVLLDALQRRGLQLKVRCAEPVYVVYLE